MIVSFQAIDAERAAVPRRPAQGAEGEACRASRCEALIPMPRESGEKVLLPLVGVGCLANRLALYLSPIGRVHGVPDFPLFSLAAAPQSLSPVP